jgi:hypothetical protein
MRKMKLFNIKKAFSFNQPKPLPSPLPLGVTHGDRKSWWTNYNVELANRISEIKRAQS